MGDGMRELVLASGSQTRRTLLTDSMVPYVCRPASVDEAAFKAAGRAAGHDAQAVALTLAEAKARAVSRSYDTSENAGILRLVIGADQMLDCEGVWFDKPADLAAAADQLRQLRGRTHVLHSAVVLMRGDDVIWRHVSHAALTMRVFSDAFLAEYLRSEGESCLSCVGAYRVEGAGIQLFEDIEGDHSTILGLPLLPLLTTLRDRGFMPV